MVQLIKKFWRNFIGYRICLVCNQHTLRFETDNPIHLEGPPLITWWQCYNPECRAQSEPRTQLLDKAAQKYGYKSFSDFIDSREKS